MHEAVARMLAKYETESLGDTVRALREIIQEVALLGLWRAKFFEHGAFYGGTALRILYGLDRFSEDLDFSLLEPTTDFNLGRFTASLEEELQAFGFNVRMEMIEKTAITNVQSAFLKANTRNQLLVIEAGDELTGRVAPGQLLKVKLEVDTDPPSGFSTETRYLLQPIPFAVRCYGLPDLFAGKMHALLCRTWQSRVKGRDWYDFVWYVANHPQLHLDHLEQRMRQTGHWSGGQKMMPAALMDMLFESIDRLDVKQARNDVEPFIRDRKLLDIWSRDFFSDIARRVVIHNGSEEFGKR